MTTSRTTSAPAKPIGREPISAGDLDYLRARNRMRLFTLVRREFQRSGLSQSELAARMRKGTDRICRLLGAPGNWTVDTASDLLWAISGAVPRYTIEYPLEKPKRNANRHADREALTPERAP